MRFLENGPRIPDELLTARDEGRVVFFCGAGVSMARAGLPNFLDLAGKVMEGLGVCADSPARKLLNESTELGIRVGADGLIPADRIFGLLEREFLPRDLESQVAKILKPSPGVDWSAHRTLLDLATTPEGKIRLVTTNFDRLFEDACRDKPRTWIAPHLPDPARREEINGIVYLHGRANAEYSGSEAVGGFVLSSAQFGRAYLAEGWATRFFKAVLDHHVVVFVGYGADDPPVRYLLEGLDRGEGQADMYAFEQGAPDQVAAKWRDKGVAAIAYPAGDEAGHGALWDTLAEWAQRARSPQGWRQSVIALAAKGPANLQPHQRGQVAHVVSTPAGAEEFSKSDPPPPAEWLCVFDPERRYAWPGWMGIYRKNRVFIDPFHGYGLDSDTVPGKIDPDDYPAKREIPPDAWDAFAANESDRRALKDGNLPAFRGDASMHAPQLPPRLIDIYHWLAKVADQPAAIWWAAHQDGLHPNIRNWIEYTFQHFKKDAPAIIGRAWGYLFEAWKEKNNGVGDSWQELKTTIERDGWDSYAIRQYAALYRPYLTAGPLLLSGPKPPAEKEVFGIGDLLRLKVEYPMHNLPMAPPDEWLLSVVRELRKNLEYALRLETEIGGHGLTNIAPIIPDDSLRINDYGRTHGLSGSVLSFAALFERLIKLDAPSARREFAAWPVEDDTIFARLRIWAGGKPGFLTAEGFAGIILDLGDIAFWDSHHQRDLLLALAQRWNELQDEPRKAIEQRILKGRTTKWDLEENHEYEKWRAWETLVRLQWLADKGCRFSFDLGTEIDRLRQAAPDWRPKVATTAAESLEIRGGWVGTDTGYSALLSEPVGNILAKARELGGRAEDDFLTERKPFKGLSTERPVRALSALTHAARRGEYPQWAWETLLNSEARENDKPKCSALIAARLCRYPDSAISGFIHSVSRWISMKGKHWAPKFPEIFKGILSKLIAVLGSHPAAGESSLVRGSGKQPDWRFEAINAPAGEIAQALFADPRTDGLKRGERLPKEWLAHTEALLSLAGDSRRYALVIFSRQFHWFYFFDPNWTEKHLLSAMEGGDAEDRDAFWSGFLGGGGRINQGLFLRIKPNLLAFAAEQNTFEHEYRQALAAIILSGWGTRDEKTRERLISNKEMRDALLRAGDEFRAGVLWEMKSRTSGHRNELTEQQRGEWEAMLPEFLRDVWPRQKIARPPETSARLCDIAFSNASRLPELAEIILPLLTKIEGRGFYSIRRLLVSEDDVIERHPRQVREILDAVLPDDRTAWPDEAEEILRRIASSPRA
uniref:SIR2-like domain-containing protein n=1 Tax=Candidatus Kentrum sp. FM TaxID=2126340 RepID=A0A450ST73_9GAMM|nr:MAG: SIR2-like domain-containing protein [Candidatus Kentron sp. FM]VFJ57048.1 MAG: SIR2-like domain-containing protein [Candidatus Kentron sp. FM]VFK11507.1 MAG: SIR2-like domain-containing protein [Candidatus Kentron sp. FM]